MSDTWGTVPYSIFDDERLDGDDGPDRTFMVMILSLTDDRGRFEGSIDALCRRTGCSKKYVQERLESVKRRELIDLYQVEGRARPVGEVIRFHLLPGLPDTKRFEAKRRESAFPARDGTVEPSRRDKAKARGTHEAKPSTERGSDAEVAPTEPSASVEAVAQDCGSDVEAMWRTDREREEREKREETDTPRARAYEPPAPTPKPPSAPPPPKLVLESLARWQAAYGRMCPTGMIPDESVLSVAADFSPEDFATGVKAHCDETDRSFWTRTPLRYLRYRCEWARGESGKGPRVGRYSGTKRTNGYSPFDPSLHPPSPKMTESEIAAALADPGSASAQDGGF